MKFDPITEASDLARRLGIKDQDMISALILAVDIAYLQGQLDYINEKKAELHVVTGGKNEDGRV